MANGINNADKLLARIIDDARAEAARLQAAGEEQAAGVRAGAESMAAQLLSEADARGEKAHDEAMERAATAAQLDARKYALKARRAVVDEAFAAAAKALAALDGEERDALIENLAVREADGGETICPSAKDASRIERLLDAVNARLAQDGRAALKLGKTDPAAEDGFTLVGAGYEKDCSLACMVRDSRDRLEGGVAKILF